MRVGVVGAGPAGITAAVFLCRYNFQVTIFEKDTIGGLIVNAWRVENFPVFYPLPGEAVVEILKNRLLSSTVKVIFEEVVEVQGTVAKTNSNSYEFDKLIVASGTIPVRLTQFEVDPNVVYEYRLLPESLTSLAIYGAGDVAFDSALKAKEKGVPFIHLFNRTRKIRALPRLVECAKSSGIIYHEGEPIEKVESGLKIFTNKAEYDFDALLICVGRKPNTDFIKTSSKDLYIVGDARGGFRQMSIAIGNAVETAMRIISEVNKN